MPTVQRRQGRFGATRFISVLTGTACVVCVTLLTGCASQNSTGVPVGSGSSDTPSSAAPSSGALTVKDDSNGKTVHVNVGTQVELLLSSSYWTVKGSSAAAVVRQDGQSTVLPRPTNCPAIPGLGCQPVQTDFTAVTAGTATITADRTACGEAMACPAYEKHFAVTVVVQ